MNVPTGGRPNIVIIMADQWAAHALGCAGSEIVQTPCLDALSGAGLRFNRAYTTFPLCVPARSSLVAGRYPHELGISGNAGVSEKTPGRSAESLGHWFTSAGYDCAYAGKWHAPGASAVEADGFEVIHPFGDLGLPEAADAWLGTRQQQEKPFLLFASFDNPHTICEYARGQHLPYGDVPPPASVRDAPPLPANFATPPASPQALTYERTQAEPSYGTSEFTADDWRLYRHTYARLIEWADGQIGSILDSLEAHGLADDTVVLFTSDHGDGDASHGWNQKTSLQEETVRIPLLMRGPGIGASQVSEQLISLGVDLIPTLCGVAGINAPPGATGHDVLAQPRTSDDGVAIETAFGTGDKGSTLGRAFIGERYKYSVYSWGKYREQLVDLIADPGEMRNLAAESAFDEVLEDFRARLLAWCLETGDAAFLKKLVLPTGVDPAVRAGIYAIPY
ncbi:MAG: sulfatase-like hydrolase/transferase [Micrococcaceae bacterium]|nr:sulfatase-like hydrolase/transferase [Micrococcaceae bacterium]